MKRLLLESGQSRADYQWKAILDKLFLDLDKPTNNKYTSNENSTFKVKAQRQQLEARKRALELQLAQINMKLEINEQELVSLPQPEDQIALVQTSIL